MRQLIFLFLVPLFLWSQDRENRELPIFEPIPYFTAGDSINGWSYSADGQWIKKPNTLPVIGISRNEDFYNNKDNALGIDNIHQLQAYKVKYGKDTLICLVKIYREGEYRYPNRKRGWKERLAGYYWIVRYRDLRNALNYFEEQDTSETFVLRIKSLEGRAIKEIEDPEDVLEQIVETTIIKPNFDRNLVLTLQEGDDSKFIRFHVISLHVVFTDIEGVRRNFTKRGRSVYGSVKLFDYMYYEMDRKEFFEILNLDANLDLLLEEEMLPVFDQKALNPIDSSTGSSLDSLDTDSL